jgi:glucose/arabinose dehydrogenase
MNGRGFLATIAAIGLAVPTGAAATDGAAATGPGPLAAPGPLQVEVTLTQVASALGPTAGTPGPGGTIWIGERAGRVRVLDDQGLGEPVLDITGETTTDGERGLAGMTFDDDFSHFYLSFTNLDGHNVVDEFEVVDGEPQLDTRRTIFFQEQPGPAHNSGAVAFGPDGMFYISIGDGDFSFDGDPFQTGQDLGTLLGKVLRIDLASGDPYGIPPDNPFVNDPAALDEIWAYGLRNPWRYSFDASTGDFWLGDVGHLTREEVNWTQAGVDGQNYGWSQMEGTLVRGDEPANHVPPVFEWEHTPTACTSVTGGYVYRGDAVPDLQGAYVFSDFCNGDIRALSMQDGEVVGETNLGVNGGWVSSFVQGADLELYVLDMGSFDGSTGGVIYRIDPA